MTDERKDGAFHFSQIGFNAPLTLELRLLYGGSLSDPVPERMRDLLAQLSAPTD
ncbi:MAG: NepR family anti-sigma factor [Methylocystis sp.]